MQQAGLTPEVNNAKIGVVQVQKGKEGWSTSRGKPKSSMGRRLADQQPRVYAESRCQPAAAADGQGLRACARGRGQDEGSAAVGIRVTHKGRPDISLFFDKASGLLIKHERLRSDLQQKEVAADVFRHRLQGF